MRVLGIETSCDETAIAIYCHQQGLLGHQIFSQKTHHDYGGVVPELASRDHLQKLLPLVDKLLQETGSSSHNIDGIAYTAGPGLIGALMVGAAFARALSFAWQKPALGVHHLEGHLLAPMLEKKAPAFPFIALLVSGGHSQLFQVNGLGQYLLLGESLDDAAGEAFDKTGKLLGLPYPGGPHLAKLAKEGNAQRFTFPRPLLKEGLNFSFSGLKTAVATTIAKESKDPQTKADIAAAFEDAVIETLVVKSKRALLQTGLNRLVVAGGVSANEKLRQALDALSKDNIEAFYPSPAFCTDNGAMIAYCGCQRLMRGEQDQSAIKVKARWPLASCS